MNTSVNIQLFTNENIKEVYFCNMIDVNNNRYFPPEALLRCFEKEGAYGAFGDRRLF